MQRLVAVPSAAIYPFPAVAIRKSNSFATPRLTATSCCFLVTCEPLLDFVIAVGQIIQMQHMCVCVYLSVHIFY